jgi:beta-N-acetylhexosaminidase
MGLRRYYPALMLLVLILTTAGYPYEVRAQGGKPSAAVTQLFENMTPEERVGQLFLVTFTGTDTSNKSQIYDLVVKHHVGGVVLLSSNDNFVVAPNTVLAAYQLTSSLQEMEWDSSVNPPIDPKTGQLISHEYVPLFIAMSQDGNGAPGDQILSGLTPLPSEMAIGATWSPDLAKQVGTIMGHELSALGINMYFGPSLDVLETPSSSPTNDLGVSVFGGNPYWVSVMGNAYISGLHTGSQNRLLVIAKHFPGRGSADRSDEQEVATVRQSLDQLKQIELAPFFAVTGNAALPVSPAGTTDGLLLSHIRYQGFQGNISATTRPVSFDAQALSSILSLPQFATWWANGGLIVSDDLGTKAVRQFYTTGTDFPARTVLRDAFVAGNDLLDLGNIVSSDAPDNYTTVLETIDYFSQKYREDPAFAQRVDASVLRILALKEHLYRSFSFQNVILSSAGVGDLGNSQQVTFEVAHSAATLLSPDAQNLATVLTAPPKVRDRIIFFTDTSQVQQCSSCAMQSGLAFDALQSAIVRLYGPQSGNQTSSFRLSSYSFDDAANYLAGKSPPYLQDDLSSAGWVIFSLTGSGRNQQQIISNFLSGQQDLLRPKHVILFAFGAPYYLDATDISRLTAYYALYSQEPPFVEVAARLLFQELTPTGASPVSIPGLGYELSSITAPDPNQLISLVLDLPASPVSTNEPIPAATPVPLYKIGDTIAIRTGAIKDHNGEPVPDGTVVQFSMNLTGEGGGILQQANAVTTKGVARVSFGLDKPGLLQIRATSDPALRSEVLQLDVSSGGQPAAVTVIIPQLTPEVVPQTTGTPTTAQDEFVTPKGTPRFIAWLLIILVLLAGAVLVYFAGIRVESMRWGIRWGLCALAGGLLSYNYMALGLPGSANFTTSNGIGGIVLITIFGLLAGWGAGWLWSRQILK